MTTENLSKKNMMINCEVLIPGVIETRNVLSVLDKEITYNTDKTICSAKDINDINNCFDLGINIISAVIHSEVNLQEIKEIVGDEAQYHMKIFAIIKSKEAIINFDDILDNSNGIIIQLDHNSSNLNFDELKLVEQYMATRCRMQNKPVILQTTNLKSINNRRLTPRMSIVDSTVNEGIDSIIVNDDGIVSNSYLATVKGFRSALLQLETYRDNRHRYEEMSR